MLDGRDWRVRWTGAVLTALETSVSALGSSLTSQRTEELAPPPASSLLTARLGGGPVESPSSYDLLVVDRPDSNAFSFGFGPEGEGGRGVRGVIVVYTGSYPFLDSRSVLTMGV